MSGQTSKSRRGLAIEYLMDGGRDIAFVPHGCECCGAQEHMIREDADRYGCVSLEDILTVRSGGLNNTSQTTKG